MNRTLAAAAAAAFATLATFGASHAATTAVQTNDLDLATTAVQTNDLDLATAEGQARLDSRINRAVRTVCSEEITGSRIDWIAKDCMARARAAVEKQVAARRATPRNGG